MRLRDMFCGNLCHGRTESASNWSFWGTSVTGKRAFSVTEVLKALTRNYLSASKIGDRRFPSAGETPVV